MLTPVRGFGIRQAFLEHGRRPELLEQIGLTAQDVARHVVETVTRLENVHLSPPSSSGHLFRR